MNGPTTNERLRALVRELFELEEPEEIERAAEMLQRANIIFSKPTRAIAWLQSPVPILGNKKPIDFVDTEKNAQHVYRILGQMADGEMIS